MKLKYFLAFIITLVAMISIRAAEPATPKMAFSATARDEAVKWQNESRAKIFEFLKLTELQKTRKDKSTAIPFAWKELKRIDRKKYIWQELEINSTATRRIKIVVTLPKFTSEETKSTERFPAVVCIHGHGGNRFVVYDKKNIYGGFATELAERGYVAVFADVGQHEVYEKGNTLMGERLWDMLRCADYVASIPTVDTERLGCGGLSLGGEMAMWLGAMDERMKVTVSSGYLTTVANLQNDHCPCWDFPGLTENFDFSDIYSLIAPRGLMCQIGQKETAPGGFPVSIAESAMQKIEKAYAVFKAEADAKLDIHPGGHVMVAPSTLEFIEKYLGKSK